MSELKPKDNCVVEKSMSKVKIDSLLYGICLKDAALGFKRHFTGIEC